MRRHPERYPATDRLGRTIEALAVTALQLTRPPAGALSRILGDYRAKAEAVIDTSFRQMIDELCCDLPAELAKRKIPSVEDAGLLDRVFLAFRKEKIARETEAAARGIFEQRLAAWRDNPPEKPGVHQALGRIVEEMAGEIQEEVRQIKQRFDRIQ